jgi:GNAT superfamily N-acetyltransferase
VRIRCACDRDLPLLPAIERAAAQLFLDYAADLGLDAAALESATPLEALRRGRENALLWVTVDADDEPLGFALARELDGQLHLEEMDVLPAHTRRGLGTALADQVWRAARARGCAVTLSTFRGVPWNAPFYAKLGFRELKEQELTASLLQIREDERRRGLHPALRVLMRRER